MSSDFELEEFNGLGTALAPRIPNAENRDLETKVKKKKNFEKNENVFFSFSFDSFEFRSEQNNVDFNRHKMILMKM